MDEAFCFAVDFWRSLESAITIRLGLIVEPGRQSTTWLAKQRNRKREKTYPAVERPEPSRRPSHSHPHQSGHAAEQCHRGIATKACSRPSGRTAGRRRGNLPSSASGAGPAKCQSRSHGYRRRRLGSVVRGCCTLSYLFSTDARASPGEAACGSPAGACWVACLGTGSVPPGDCLHWLGGCSCWGEQMRAAAGAGVCRALSGLAVASWRQAAALKLGEHLAGGPFTAGRGSL